MIKIGNYKIETQVYRSSDGVTYNFACDKSQQKKVENGFATANSVEFTFGDGKVTLYAPKLVIEQIQNEELTVIFTASELPVSKQAEYDEDIANIKEGNTDRDETIEAISEGLAELAEMVADLIGGNNG